MEYEITSTSLAVIKSKINKNYYKKLCKIVGNKYSCKEEFLNDMQNILSVEDYGSMSEEILKIFEAKNKYKNLIIVTFSFLFIIIIYIIFLLYFIICGNRNELGDSFGTLNALFTGLAFSALIVTLFFQREELKMNREELSLTRIEFREQNNVLKKQNFEDTFFRLLSLHNDIVDSLEFGIETKRKCFLNYLKSLELFYDQGLVDNTTKTTSVSDRYNSNYKNIAFSVEHYHKNLYQILSFVHHKGIEGNKKQYSNFIRSQLSRYELNLLFFHGLSQYGVANFKPLIEKYEMLEHLPDDTFLLKENMGQYEKSAFGKNPDLLKLYDEQRRI